MNVLVSIKTGVRFGFGQSGRLRSLVAVALVGLVGRVPAQEKLVPAGQSGAGPAPAPWNQTNGPVSTLTVPQIDRGSLAAQLPRAVPWMPAPDIKPLFPLKLPPAALVTTPDPGRGSTRTPGLGRNFGGLGYTGWQPPDPIIAVGPNHVIVMVNESWAIYSKDGVLLYSSTLSSWFAGQTPPGGPFDPKVIYDANAGRWVMLAFANGGGKSAYLISVSANSNPIGSWWNWSLDSGLDATTQSGFWSDFPGLGYDGGQAVYITSNQYDFSPGNFHYAKLRILYKSQLYWVGSGGGLGWWDFWNWSDGDGGSVFTWKPAQAQSYVSGNYLLDTRAGGANFVTLWRLTNPLASGPTLTRQATVSTGSYSPAPGAAQQGGAQTLDTGDCRTQEVQYQNGKIVTAFSEYYDWGSGGNAVLRTLVIDGTSNNLDVNNRFGASGFWYFYPAIVRDVFGNMGVVFNRSGSAEYPGARYTVWTTSDTTWEGSASLQPGQAYYVDLRPPAYVNRWGDYSGAGLDPMNLGTFWAYSEYSIGLTTWGTWAGEIPIVPAPSNDQCAGATPMANGVTYAQSIIGATSNGDPSPTCGYNVINGVWYSFTPAYNEPVLISSCGSSFDTVMQVYSGTCGALNPVVCDDDFGPGCGTVQASVEFYATAGTTYYVLVGGYNGAYGNLSMTAYAPANDTCQQAIPLASGTPYDMNTGDATSAGDPTPSCQSTFGNGVWFTYTPGVNGVVSIDTCGSDFDTVLQAYTGTCSALTPVAGGGCNDDSGVCAGNIFASFAEFTGTAGTTYYILVGGYGSARGNLHIVANVAPPATLTVNSAPGSGVSVGSEPQDITGGYGGFTSFNRTYAQGTVVDLFASANDGFNVFSKWQLDGVDLTTSSSASVLMGANHTATAVYVTPPSGQLNASYTGWYQASGSHNPANANYYTGGTNHSFFVFNVPYFTTSVVDAELLVNCYSNVSTAPTANQTFLLRDVTTPIATLVAGGSGLTAIYNDLGDGTIYGIRDLAVSESGMKAIIPLNASFINALMGSQGGQLALGGSITVPTATGNDYLFGFSLGNVGDVQLRLTFGPTFLVNANARGWYDSTGFHGPNNSNYVAGVQYPSGPWHNFFVFPVPVLGAQVVNAQLLLNSYIHESSVSGYYAAEHYSLHDVTTPIPTLVAGGSGLTAIYNDLANGADYGGRNVYTNESGFVATIPLNSTFWQAAQAASGSQIALGGSVDLTPTMTNDFLFGFSNGNVPSDTQLWLGLASNWPHSPVLQPPFSHLLNGNFQFSVNGTAASYEIDATTNLKDWDVLGSLTMTNPVSVYTDTTTSGIPYRYYRARLLP